MPKDAFHVRYEPGDRFSRQIEFLSRRWGGLAILDRAKVLREAVDRAASAEGYSDSPAPKSAPKKSRKKSQQPS